MTRKELKLALKEMEERDAYSLRLFLDNHTTVLAHQWFLEDGDEWGNEEEDGDDGKADADRRKDGGTEGLLRVVVRNRQALIAVSRIVLIEMVPFGG